MTILEIITVIWSSFGIYFLPFSIIISASLFPSSGHLYHAPPLYCSLCAQLTPFLLFYFLLLLMLCAQIWRFGARNLRWKTTYDDCLSGFGQPHQIWSFLVLSISWRYGFVFLYWWVQFHIVYALHFCYPFISWRTKGSDLKAFPWGLSLMAPECACKLPKEGSK